jgi:hypothetical protein
MRTWFGAVVFAAACTGVASTGTTPAPAPVSPPVDAGPQVPVLIIDAGPECEGKDAAECAAGARCVNFGIVGLGHHCLAWSIQGVCMAVRCPASEPVCGEYITGAFCEPVTDKEGGL